MDGDEVPRPPTRSDPDSWTAVVGRALADPECRRDLLAALPQVLVVVVAVAAILAVAMVVIVLHVPPLVGVATVTGTGLLSTAGIVAHRWRRRRAIHSARARPSAASSDGPYA